MNSPRFAARLALVFLSTTCFAISGCSKPKETPAGGGQSAAVKPSATPSPTPSATAAPAPAATPAAPTPTPSPSASAAASAPTTTPAPAAADPAVEAYIYGYPLVTMEYTRRVMTNVDKPTGKLAPMGEFAHLRSYPTPADKEVTAPNADTLYSLAWLDLGKASYYFDIPDSQDRYYLMPMLNGFTDVFQVPGKRTTGTKAQKYFITGPNWKPRPGEGELPPGTTHFQSATNLVWILGRTYCNGTPEDYAAVHKFQDGLKLTPDGTGPVLPADPKLDMKTAIREQVHALDSTAYFTLLAKLLKDNPPTAADAPMVATLAKVGIEAGKDFDAAKVDAATATTLADAPKTAQAKIMGHMKQAGTMVNGWTFSEKTGLYGTDYLQRAFITAVGLGANRPQDAVYPTAEVAGDGKPLDGANKYAVHFEKGKFPPAKAFWSITMYDDKYFFVPNPLERYTVSSRFPFKLNDDGSLDLVIQHESPGKDKEANWLPAPAGKFILMMRLYWPEESMLDGSWKIPPVTAAK